MTTEQLIEIRRQIHRNPELGYKESKTSLLISNILYKNNIDHQVNVADTGTGIWGSVTNGPGKTVLLRADMDALPIKENTGLPYSSTNNYMHACGHDIHTSMLLGALLRLNENKLFRGTVKFVFQPSEEGPNGDKEGKSGGQRISESSFLNDVDFALALHLHPQIPVGKIAYSEGTAVAYASFFSIEITGSSSHAGASPELANDAIIAAIKAIADLQTIVSRDIAPGTPAVLSVTMINGGTAENIIAEKVMMKGTIRALDYIIYDAIVSRIQQILHGIEIGFSVVAEFKTTVSYPDLENSKELHTLITPALESVFGLVNVVKIPTLLIGEDFAFYSKKIPCMFYYLGAQTGDLTYFLHDNRVIFNEKCIQFGLDFFCKASEKILE